MVISDLDRFVILSEIVPSKNASNVFLNGGVFVNE